MRIESITLRNYRQFRQAQITFRKRPDTDLHYIIGTNGTGKTNLLNAVNWCLYDDEPHLSKSSESLPLVNLETIDRTEVGKDQEVVVEVRAETGQGSPVTFTRRAVFRKRGDGQMAPQGTTFEVRFVDEKGNTKTVADEDAQVWVERFVPRGIREFFFFDGERLDNYFREATGQNIRHAVSQISQIDLLETRVERRLKEILDDLRKEAGKVNPQIEEARTKLDQAQAHLDEIEQRIRECENQIAIARAKVAEYHDKLRDIPDIEALEKEREQLQTDFGKTTELLRDRERERGDLLFECGTILMLWPAINEAIRVIEGRREKREIPPPIGRGFLEEVLRIGICNVCGRQLDARSRDRVRELLQGMEPSSDIAVRLMQMEPFLRQFRGRVERFEKQTRHITREMGRYREELTELTRRRNEIDSQIAGYNEEQIKRWYKERAQFEEARDQNLTRLGELRSMRQEAEKSHDDAKKQYEKELEKEGKAKGLKKKEEFCTRALDIVRSTREAIMEETRKRIEGETKRRFIGLLWKKATFGDVRIEADYSISLIHSMGYECLGSVSAGERELLALSFTLALHQVSGFDSPILIDTPVARISDVHRENFGKVLSEVSTTKQIILLFTPDEYSGEISRFLDGRASGRYRLKLTPNEREVKVEVLR
ncbi:MAG: AAA family ATPase [Candidatus Methanomethyliaceae archaeon]